MSRSISACVFVVAVVAVVVVVASWSCMWSCSFSCSGSCGCSYCCCCGCSSCCSCRCSSCSCSCSSSSCWCCCCRNRGNRSRCCCCRRCCCGGDGGGGVVWCSSTSKSGRTWCAFHILTWTCASRHNAVHFFNILWTSKNAPNLSVFYTFFAPRRRALFQHLNFEKCSEPVNFSHFSLRTVLRAMIACNFSSLSWPDGSAPAALASLRSHKTLEKHSDSRLFYIFPRLHLLSSDSISSLMFFLLLFSSLLWLFPPLLFHLSILSEVWLLNFPR